MFIDKRHHTNDVQKNSLLLTFIIKTTIDFVVIDLVSVYPQNICSVSVSIYTKLVSKLIKTNDIFVC